MEGIDQHAQRIVALINFVFDQPGYPNFAQPDLSVDEFDHTWPRAVPCRLLTYFNENHIPWQSYLPEQAPVGSWYPISLAWFDQTINYHMLLNNTVRHLVKKGRIKLLFYYHEADSPGRIKFVLDFWGAKSQFPKDYYLFVSGNTAAEYLENFAYFPDHELFFKELNKHQTPIVTAGARPYDFTALNRTHKMWRATVMSELHRANLLTRSLWSYNTLCELDNDLDNPINLDQLRGCNEYMEFFLGHGPYFCDGNDHVQHNNHRVVNTDLYTQSYCHIVIETLFDIEQSGGAFLTEKTYKAIKYGQPFVIVGAVGSLAALRQAGYRTFDHAIDNSYDLIYDNVQRLLAVKNAIAKIKSSDMQKWFESCQEDIAHNQQHYLNSQSVWLKSLAADLDTV